MPLSAEQMLASRSAGPDWLVPLRDQAAEQFLAREFPSRRHEAWRYSDLNLLAKILERETAAQTAETPLPSALRLDSIQLVFVDGVYQDALSTVPSVSGLRIDRFSTLAAADRESLNSALNRCVNEQRHAFSTFSTAAIQDGIWIRADEALPSHQVVHIQWLHSGRQAAVAARVLLDVAPHAQLSLVEEFHGQAPALCHSLTELNLQENAQLNYHRVHTETGESGHLGGVHARLAQHSRLRAFQFALGSFFKRIDLDVHCSGPGASCELYGAYLLKYQQHCDHQVNIEHAAPHCDSNTVFRGVIGDAARAVFNGRIHIHPQAQRTSAQLNNRNLLTGANAEVYTKPELEIYADDVRCAHGATVAQLDHAMVHYLRSRGISEEEATVMLSYGFIREVFNGVDLEPLLHYLMPIIGEFFARDPALTRHLV
jgi:Fe-S cluster assembly protein SufD